MAPKMALKKSRPWRAARRRRAARNRRSRSHASWRRFLHKLHPSTNEFLQNTHSLKNDILYYKLTQTIPTTHQITYFLLTFQYKNHDTRFGRHSKPRNLIPQSVRMYFFHTTTRVSLHIHPSPAPYNGHFWTCGVGVTWGVMG